MINILNSILSIIINSILILFFIFNVIAKEKELYIYNWSDYISDDIIPNFEKKTGIKVIYDVFDSNELLEGKLMAGKTGYDIVVPSSNFLSRQLEFGIFQKLNKKKLLNYKNLDLNLMKKLEQHDLGNKYAVPYLWATTGIGYNYEKIKMILGKDAPLDSWDLILNPENLKKLQTCGVSFLDAPEEIFSIILNYLGKNPNSENIDDYTNIAANFLFKIRPYIRYFHSSHYIDDLANGNICAAIGWAGDILKINSHILKVNIQKKVNIIYILPKEGTVAFFDMIAIPKDAKNIDEIYQFIDYILEPKIIAKITNKIFYSNANKKSLPWIDENIKNITAIYPSKTIMSKLFILKSQNLKLQRIQTRLWIKIKSGR